MAYSPEGKNLALAGVAAGARWLGLHTGDPGTTGANAMAGGARGQTTWDAPDGDSVTGSPTDIGVPTGGPYTHWGLYDTETGGDFITGGELDNPETYGAPGVYVLTPTLTA
jgi:hypothetical protein